MNTNVFNRLLANAGLVMDVNPWLLLRGLSKSRSTVDIDNIVWERGHPSHVGQLQYGTGEGFLEALEPGDRIGIIVRACKVSCVLKFGCALFSCLLPG